MRTRVAVVFVRICNEFNVRLNFLIIAAKRIPEDTFFVYKDKEQQESYFSEILKTRRMKFAYQKS